MVDHELIEAVRRLAAAFDRRNVPYALIGGLAVGLHSRPRATKDADFIVNVPALAFPGLLEELVSEGFEIDVMDVLRRWPVDRFTVFTRGRVRIDWMQPILPLYANVLNSAVAEPWQSTSVKVATPEGLILTKLLAFRPVDQADIETLLIGHRDQIDLNLIRQEWSAVADAHEPRTVWLEEAVARLVPPRS